MPLTEENHVIKAVPPDRTDQPLRVSILPRRPLRARSVPPIASWRLMKVSPYAPSVEAYALT
jgi:hypothetical protein